MSMLYRSIVNLIAVILSAVLVCTSCLKGDDPGPLLPEKDGIYIKGKATAFEEFSEGGMMQPAVNAATGQARQGLYEIYVAVSAGNDGFSIIEIANREQTIYGPVTREFAAIGPSGTKTNNTTVEGIIGTDAGVFTVDKDGIYHIVLDIETERYLISHVPDLEVYARFSGDEWSTTVIPLSGGFDKTNMMFKVDELSLYAGEFRIRYGGADMIGISGEDVMVYTYFGGSMTGSPEEFSLAMVPGGDTYEISDEHSGIYTCFVNWTVGEGFSATMHESSTASYPERIFVIGDGISSHTGEEAWVWELNDFEMIPVHSRSHIFWKIVWLNGSGTVRFSSAKDWEEDFGYGNEIEDGLYSLGDEDMPVPEKEGFYMITINLRSGKVTVNRPEVYLIGEPVGDWTTRNQDARVMVYDEFELLRLQKFLNGGAVRMYAWHPDGWFTHWWHTEFNVYDGNIEFRGNGPNIESVNVTAGIYIIELNFRTGNGSVERCDCSP